MPAFERETQLCISENAERSTGVAGNIFIVLKVSFEGESSNVSSMVAPLFVRHLLCSSVRKELPALPGELSNGWIFH